MPIPRRFDRRPPERDTTRTNERIRVPEVRLIAEDGKQVGVIKTPEALAYAQERDLDLVEVAPEARPPVCRVLDYSKYKYEQAQKQKAARRHQQQINVREIKFRPKIAQHDYDTKKGHVTRFLRNKDKVKVTIMFRGREVAHPERGQMLLERLAEELADLAVVEQRPLQDGRNMTMMLGPSKAVLAGEDGRSGSEASTPAADEASAPAASEGSAPAADEGSAPAADEGSAPAADGGSAPAADEGSAPAASEDSAEQQPEDTPEPAGADAAPGADEGSAPAASEGSAPAADEGSAPDTADAAPPSAEAAPEPAGD